MPIKFNEVSKRYVLKGAGGVKQNWMSACKNATVQRARLLGEMMWKLRETEKTWENMVW